MTEDRRRARELVGTVVDGMYRLDRLLAVGGMGSVYEAVQLRLNRRVAVKVMARELVDNVEALARFRREVHVTSQLAHPHIVHVSDFGNIPGGELYLVMELLDGEDLEQRLRRVSRLPLPSVVHVVRQVASALSATHARGVVHRDLKPANVFLLQVEGEHDFVKVLDFGISKVKAASTRLTRTSVVMGTPKYMSPEHAMGRVDKIDHRSDQWALACIAWEMLAGREPFVGGDVTTLLYTIVHGEPSSLVAAVEGLPPEVEEVLRRAMSKRPRDRFATVAAFARAFASAADPNAVTASLTPPPRARAATPPPIPAAAAMVSRRVARAGTPTPFTPPPSPPGASLFASGAERLSRLRDRTEAFVAGLPDRWRRRKTGGVMAYTMAVGRRVWDDWGPARPRKRQGRKIALISAAGVGATLLLGALLLMRSGWRPLP